MAVELDGDQHLADPVAYRRDRRKDVLLQENGYLVLRFLAQDVGKDLERVLDTILRALAHQPGRSRTGSLGIAGPSGEGGRTDPPGTRAYRTCSNLPSACWRTSLPRSTA
ncbi:endonuclease domain-containing protein [Piscinibacter sp.]|uniref:endonuclease domain-containing protein n=1 Tax=Piscinibacter sp. TaxID=1903157 RepID=UPI00391F1310